MNEAGDKMVTTQEATHENAQEPRTRKGGRNGGPHTTVKFGSACVPVYLSQANGRTRYFLSYHRDGNRMRQAFADLKAAKKEALLVAQRIQAGMQHVTDIKPHERECYLAAVGLLQKSGIPLVAAVEEYVRARDLAGTESLITVAGEYGRLFRKVVQHVTVGQVVTELMAAKRQDKVSKRYLLQLQSSLNRFAAKFPGPILNVTGAEIDAWLRALKISSVTRNSMLRCIKVLFSYARSQNYLPEERATASDQVKVVRVKGGDVTVFTPKEMAKILHAAPPDLIPILAIGAFSGIRMAELNRLDWSAIDLDRCFIEVRAGQAKTASRRIIPVSDNLAAWLSPLERRGKVVRMPDLHNQVTALARALGLDWPRNVLRHSFISYRIAKVKSADEVALEAGNSASIIFKHYRELTTEELADAWFGILPKPGQWENAFEWDRRARVVTLPDSDGE